MPHIDQPVCILNWMYINSRRMCSLLLVVTLIASTTFPCCLLVCSFLANIAVNRICTFGCSV